jgi:hypothetical protein
MRLLIILLLLLCSGCGTFLSSASTTLEPVPVKFSIQSSSISIRVPIVTEKKKTGGYRSPVELSFDVDLTKITGIPTPVKPVGGACGIKIRW